ncbi:MAG: carboxypeptidase regulatory-like domain-containing protein [Bacteroidia bacterium]
MKKIATLLLSSFTLLVFAQGPTIEGTYLPVRGTAIKQVWDTLPGTIPLPASGTNMLWDYRGYFTNTANTFKIATFPADTTPYFSYFNTQPDSATHASYLYSPLNNTSDSLYSYYIVDRQDGLYMLGGRSELPRPHYTGSSPNYYVGNDTTYVITNKNPDKHGELYAPANISYSSPQIYDTTLAVTYGEAYTGAPFYQTLPLIFKEWNHKTFKAIGYGTLIMPDSTVYNDVLLARIQLYVIDSIFNGTNGMFVNNTMLTQLGLNGLVQNPQIRTRYQYAFLRNNTFGSAYLMYFLGADSIPNANNYLNGWYTLPVDFGTITGTVYTDTTENTLVTQGEARLYRENSNFAKHDILAKVQLDNNGNFTFDSIPFGVYRVAIRADTSVYNRALTTYSGDSTNWLTAATITTFNDSLSDGHKIHLQYYPDTTGLNNIQGQLYWNFGIQTQGQPNIGNDRSNQPIPGIDVVVRKKPAGNAFAEPKTDANGVFTLGNLPDGEYSLHVDIPGCPHETTYDFCVYGGQTLNVLDYHCGTKYLHALNPIDTNLYTCNPITTSLTVAEDMIAELQAYPNPYTSNTTLKISIAQKSDVSLEVYDVLGAKIKTLDKGVKYAGNYSYSFSANEFNCPAGVYFVRFIANEKISVLKIIEY